MKKKIKFNNKWVMIALGLLFVMGVNVIIFGDETTKNREALQEEEIAFDKKVEDQVVIDDTAGEETTLAEERKKEQDDAVKEMNASRVSVEEFEAIKEGMTIEEVKAVIGGPLELLSEADNTQMYMAEGVGSLGANANFTFVDGKLFAKAQFGLGGE